MTEQNNHSRAPLDAEEGELMESFDAGEWKKVPDQKFKAIKKSLQGAKLEKPAKTQITIKLGSSDIEVIKQKALETGIPYQNIIGALVHNYAAGKIKLEV